MVVYSRIHSRTEVDLALRLRSLFRGWWPQNRNEKKAAVASLPTALSSRQRGQSSNIHKKK